MKVDLVFNNPKSIFPSLNPLYTKNAKIPNERVYPKIMPLIPHICKNTNDKITINTLCKIIYLA